MTSPTDRARNSDRDAALKTVNAALASGRIVQADRDKRVTEIQRSQTMQDITTQVADLTDASAVPVAPMVASSTTTSSASGQTSWPLVNYGSQSPAAPAASSSAAKKGRSIGGVIAAVALVAVVLPIVGAVIAFASAKNSFDFDSVGPTDDTTYAPGQAPGKHGVNLFTPAGYAKLVAAVKKATGGTTVYNAVIYPRYASLEIPDQTGAGHYESYFWNGKTLDNEDSKGSEDSSSFDLLKVSPDLMIGLVEKVRARMDKPTSWYCVAEASLGKGDLSCYASNAYTDSSYIDVNFDGTVIYDSAAQAAAPTPPALPTAAP